jgi:hypothetical protein
VDGNWLQNRTRLADFRVCLLNMAIHTQVNEFNLYSGGFLINCLACIMSVARLCLESLGMRQVQQDLILACKMLFGHIHVETANLFVLAF